MKRNNILIIVIVAIIIVGIGIGVTLYEQQQVKYHLAKANEYHSQMMSYNTQLNNATSLVKSAAIINSTNPIRENELKELRAANTMFASQVQKDYINAAIGINTDNGKIDDIIIKASETTNLNDQINYLSNENNIDKDRATLTQTRDSIISAHPEEFGFEVVKI